MMSTMLLIVVACSTISVAPPTEETSRQVSILTMESNMSKAITEKAPSSIQTEVMISEQELNERVVFSVLWPTYLTDEFPFQGIGTFAINGEQPEQITDVILNYGSGQDKWLMIEQTTDFQGIKLNDFVSAGEIQIGGQPITVYEKVKNIDGNFTVLYFVVKEFTMFIRATGLSKAEMLKVASSLQPK